MHYYKYSDYLKKRFGTRVHKVSVDAGFSCPNMDGKISNKGCIYCDNRAFSFYNRRGKNLSLEDQISSGIEGARKRFKAEKFIVYFQAYTNTYAPLQELKNKYDIIRNFKDVVGLAIGTRPDCVDEKILGLISGYAKDYEVWIEYGLQSMHNNTLNAINRGHSYEDFLNAYNLTRRYPIKICIHVILGLPGETEAMMMLTARSLAGIKIDAVKIHPLHVIKGTALEESYNRGEFEPIGLDKYIKLVEKFLQCLPPDTIVQRLSAYCPKEILVAPDWVSQKQGHILF
jgi:uncharacterized protein